MAPQASSPRRPILCAVLDGAALGADPGRFAERLFLAGVDWIQLRDRVLEGDALYRIARALVAVARDIDAANAASSRNPPRVILNRRADIAWAAGADGVHLGFNAIAVPKARQLLGDDALIGVSLHSPTEAESALESGANYAHLAPIWDPISKPASRPPLGLQKLAEAASLGLPLLAQGGLDPLRADQAVQAGAAGIAVTGQFHVNADPTSAARELRDHLDRDSPPTGQISRNQSARAGDREPTP